MAKKQIWALTTNGAKAKIVKNLGSRKYEEVIEVDRYPDRVGEMLTVRAGRTCALRGKSRSGLELHSDPVRNQERIFAEKLSAMLTAELQVGKIDALLIAAPPRTLGDLRKVFSNKLIERIVLQVVKDYTGTSKQELLSVWNCLLRKRDGIV